jgi:hypothetical protein
MIEQERDILSHEKDKLWHQKNEMEKSKFWKMRNLWFGLKQKAIFIKMQD